MSPSRRLGMGFDIPKTQTYSAVMVLLSSSLRFAGASRCISRRTRLWMPSAQPRCRRYMKSHLRIHLDGIGVVFNCNDLFVHMNLFFVSQLIIHRQEESLACKQTRCISQPIPQSAQTSGFQQTHSSPPPTDNSLFLQEPRPVIELHNPSIAPPNCSIQHLHHAPLLRHWLIDSQLVQNPRSIGLNHDRCPSLRRDRITGLEHYMLDSCAVECMSQRQSGHRTTNDNHFETCHVSCFELREAGN